MCCVMYVWVCVGMCTYRNMHIFIFSIYLYIYINITYCLSYIASMSNRVSDKAVSTRKATGINDNSGRSGPDITIEQATDDKLSKPAKGKNSLRRKVKKISRRKSHEVNGWTKAIEENIERIGNETALYAWLHKKSASILTNIQDQMTLAAAIISVITSAGGIITFMMQLLSEYKLGTTILTGIVVAISATVSIITVIQKTRDFAAKIEKHKEAEAKYNVLNLRIQEQMQRHIQSRTNGESLFNWVAYAISNISHIEDIEDGALKEFSMKFEENIPGIDAPRKLLVNNDSSEYESEDGGSAELTGGNTLKTLGDNVVANTTTTTTANTNATIGTNPINIANVNDDHDRMIAARGRRPSGGTFDGTWSSSVNDSLRKSDINSYHIDIGSIGGINGHNSTGRNSAPRGSIDLKKIREGMRIRRGMLVDPTTLEDSDSRNSVLLRNLYPGSASAPASPVSISPLALKDGTDKHLYYEMQRAGRM